MPSIFCLVYENKKRCIAVAESQTPPLWTKNIAIKYHHFRSHVKKNKLVYVDSDNQLVDFLTKTIYGKYFFRILKMLCGW